MISPACWISQENGNRSINAFDLALNQVTRLKSFYVTFNWGLRHEIEYTFIERNHCIQRFRLNCLPKFISCFWFNALAKKLYSKYSFDIFWVIRWKSIITLEDQIKGSSIFCFNTNVRKLLWAICSFRNRQPTCSAHYRPKQVLPPFGIGRKEHSLMNGVWMRV